MLHNLGIALYGLEGRGFRSLVEVLQFGGFCV